MQRVLLLFLIICVCILIPLGFLLAGDYYNFPLWPINYFNKVVPVNFYCQITDPYTIPLERVSSGNSFVIVDIRDENLKKILLFQDETLSTDSNGLLRIYLPEGIYKIRAHLIGVKGERIVKFGTGEPNEFKIHTINRENNKIKLNLYQLKESDIFQMIARMKKYVEDGYLDQAYTLALGLERIEANNAHDVNLKGSAISIKEKLGELKDLISELGRLDIDQYNSRINIYQKILNLLKEILQNTNEKEIRIIKEGQLIFPLRIIQALERTRNSIIQTHISNIQDFINIGKYSKATVEWMRLKNNFELYSNSPLLANSAAPLFENAKQIIDSGQKRIQNHLGKLYESALQNYYVGNFEKSREEFNQLYNEYMSLRGEFHVEEEMIRDVYSYIRDLMYIDKGLNDYMMKDYWNATDSFKSIVHWTTTIQSMMDEMRLPVTRTPLSIESSQPALSPTKSPGF